MTSIEVGSGLESNSKRGQFKVAHFCMVSSKPIEQRRAAPGSSSCGRPPDDARRFRRRDRPGLRCAPNAKAPRMCASTQIIRKITDYTERSIVSSAQRCSCRFIRATARNRSAWPLSHPEVPTGICSAHVRRLRLLIRRCNRASPCE